jgi:hypothetical protein
LQTGLEREKSSSSPVDNIIIDLGNCASAVFRSSHAVVSSYPVSTTTSLILNSESSPKLLNLNHVHDIRKTVRLSLSIIVVTRTSRRIPVHNTVCVLGGVAGRCA